MQKLTRFRRAATGVVLLSIWTTSNSDALATTECPKLGWSEIGGGVSGQFPSAATVVNAIVEFDDGDGLAMYVAGSFTSAGGVPANGIARWNGTSWSPLGQGVNDTVRAMAVVNEVEGPMLYVGGLFTLAGGTQANRIAKWNPSTKNWSPLGVGTSSFVYAIAGHDDGTGPAVYVGGQFLTAGGVTVNRIAKWDGTTWSALGSGTNNSVFALASFNDGSGPALYVGGGFTTAGGITVNRVARWQLGSWSALGSGVSGQVNALAVHDAGDGPALFAAGLFTSAGGNPAHKIAQWKDSEWNSLGLQSAGDINALASYVDSDRALYIVGISHRKWDGNAWQELSSGVQHEDFSSATSYSVCISNLTGDHTRCSRGLFQLRW